MDKSAVEQIQQSHTAAATNVALDKANLDRPVVAIPDSFHLEDLEHMMPERARMRGTMTTTNLPAFVEYCEQRNNDDSTCFVDSEGMAAKAIFNLGYPTNPGHADYTARLELKKTAEYRALTEIDGRQLSQKQAAEWIEDWADFLTAFDAEGNDIPLSRVVAAVRRLTIEASRKEDHDTQDFRASRSALESIEARSDDGLPAGFRFRCVPYLALSARDFEIRLSILTGGDAPKLVARLRRLEAIEQDMGNEFHEIMGENLDCAVYLGSYNRN